MSIRAFFRSMALAVGLLLAVPLLWQAAGPWSLLAGPGLMVVVTGYLALSIAWPGPPRSRWQIRYEMEVRQPQTDERLGAVLSFLAGRGARLALEASDQGIVLEAPPAYDRYLPVQLDRTLPEAKIGRVEGGAKAPEGSPLFLLAEAPTAELLCWATQAPGRQVRLHLRRRGCVLVARTEGGDQPPGAWMPLPLSRRLAAAAWRSLPLWDELSAGVEPGRLLPTTGPESPYRSRSRLLHLAPPQDVAGGERYLGRATDGQPLALEPATPLLTVGAPPAFLIHQALQDLARGRAVVVVSPHRRLLYRIQRQARATTYWLDQENARLSAHLAVVAAAEWAAHPPEVDAVVGAVEGFLQDLGLDLHLPFMRDPVRDLVRILAASARATGNDFAFTDLYSVCQNMQALKAFLGDLAAIAPQLDAGTQDTVRRLLAQADDDLGYVQLTAVLSTVRAALSAIRAGALHALCRPPFLNTGQALAGNSLILVPVTEADFAEHNRFLAAMVSALLRRCLRSEDHPLRIALHLHDPARYDGDAGRGWLELARRDPRLSLLLDVQDPGARVPFPDGDDEARLVFRCGEALAPALIAAWELGYTVAELTEIPAGTALARLPGLPGPVTLCVDGASAEGVS